MTTPIPDKTEVDNQHPWLGLASFTEETRPYFYGREEEVGELSRRVQRKLLTVLFGQSGLGKTSILNAGIVPRLRPEGYCPVYVRVDYGTAALPPAEQIKQAIFRATEAQGTWTKSGSACEGESLWEFLHHRDDELVDAAGKPIIPLLIFDQFEEIFTLAQADDGGRKRAAEFIEDLADLVENRPPKALEARIDADDTVAEQFDFGRADYRILISLREDYLANLESVKTAMPSITQNRMRLARMNGEQALAAVMKPGGKLVTQEVAESIVRFVAGGAELRNAEVEPSLLSLICRELNNARLAQNKKEISVDLIAGSNETILAEFYERALADQPAAVRKVIEDDLLTDSGYRENLAEERVLKAINAAGAGQNNTPAAATILATLVNRRLLRIEERLDIRRVELTHDVLCGVIKVSREVRLEREVLADAEQKLAAQQASERATREALVRARQIAAGCIALSVLAVGSGIYGFLSAERAKGAEAEAVLNAERAKGAQAEAVLSTARAKGAEAKAVLNADRAIAAQAEAVLNADRAKEAQVAAVLNAERAKGAETVAVKTRQTSEASRAESEKLVVFILDDFYEEMAPLGRLEAIGGIAQKAVEYYKQLPPEAQTPDTKRNSALAQARYAQVLTLLVRADEAKVLIYNAKKTLSDMRAGGDTSDETAIAVARVAVAEAGALSWRFDIVGAGQAAEAALAVLAPVLAKPGASMAARFAEANLRYELAFSLLRRSRPEAAIDQYTAARKFFNEAGGTDLSNLPATTALVTTGWQLADALIAIGEKAAAIPILQDTIRLGERLLEKRPGHRLAMREIGQSTSRLGYIEAGNLNFAGALKYARESQRIHEATMQLDPANFGSRQVLRLAKASASAALFALGRVDEDVSNFQALLVIDKAEKLTGAGMLTQSGWHGRFAVALAQMGRMDAANAELKKQEDYANAFLRASNDKGVQLEAMGNVASSRARVAMANGKPDGVEAEMSKHIAAQIAHVAELGKAAVTEADTTLAGYCGIVTLALLAKGEYANAADYAQKEVIERQKGKRLSLAALNIIHQASTRLAVALAKQGKLDEASKTIEPVLAFYQLPEVQKSDGVTLKGAHARALYAAALSRPAQKQALLAQALQTFDTMPAPMKALRDWAELRGDIVKEKGR